jgi:hypothetical protein
VFYPGHVAIYAGSGTMVDEPQTYDRPSGPAGRWTHAYARVDPVQPHALGYYRFAVPAPAPAPAPSPSPPPWTWPTTTTTPESVWNLGGVAPKD